MGKISRALNKAEDPGQEDRPVLNAAGNSGDAPLADVAIGFKDIATPRQTVPNEQDLPAWDERLISASETFSGVAESFRKLRTLILHPDAGKAPRSILVVSTDPQEGKSFVCANLGITMARGVGRRGLMIDCDLRRPSLHSLFGLKNSQGLADYLSGTGNLADFVHRTGLANLSLVPAGPPPKNPAELISSERMSAMVRAIVHGDEDCLLLLDSAPLLAAAETLVLAQMVDKVVLVVRWGKAGRENIKQVVEQIGREKIIGVVFNAFEMNILDKKIQGVGYHNYYSESYY
ncbi:MAG: CpsD/CapB family tyrosine-protein kinase [Thermodesulfobacteriota bacterium]